MSLPTSIAAYRDCQELFEKAESGAKGARAKLGSFDECINLRSRLHYYRKLLRKESELVYKLGEPGYGVSAYDDFVVQIYPDEDGEAAWIYISRRSAKILALETLDDDDDLIDVEGGEVHLIEDKSNASS